MSAARKLDAAKEVVLQPLNIFRERCEARAILVEACLFDLQDAVNGLQIDAERTGLVAELGQDAVQRMMAQAFAIVPKIKDLPLRGGRPPVQNDPPETATKPASEQAQPLSSVSEKQSLPTESSTLRTAEYLIQQNEPSRLKAWLAKRTRAERLAIIKHIRRK